MRIRSRWASTTLKNKLILTFSVLIVLPFSTVSLYHFHQFEYIMQEKISEQVNDQLGSINRTLEDLMGVAFKTGILIEQDSLVVSYFKRPEDYHLLERHNGMDAKFMSINNSFFLSSPSVYYTLLDFNGNVYTSFRSRETLFYEDLIKQQWYKTLLKEPTDYYWVLNDENYVNSDLSRSAALLSLYMVLKEDQHNSFGVARISLDFSEWFESVTRNLPAHQDYFIMEENGKMIVQSNLEGNLSLGTKDSIISDHKEEGYFLNEEKTNLINYEYIDTLGWYMVNRVSLDVMYEQVNEMKNHYMYTFIILILLFMIATLIISTKYTRPLKDLQKKMAKVAEDKLKTHLPEKNYQGEMLALAQNFNGMIEDLNQLVKQLKMEERQKEAVKYQMLQAQLNPHFLHNTLNTVKWLAIREGNEKITDICISLGKLLEASLNHEQELISLDEELALIQSYEFIQKFRYQSTFEILYEYDPSYNRVLVPKFSLQPLVENAIYHGITAKERVLKISIHIYKQNDYLFMEVMDNGVGLHVAKINSKRKRPGIGLKNIRERLALLFNDRADLEILTLSGGTKVKLYFPFMLMNKDKGGSADVDRITR
ncbi:cache domain-containing sensor histidine kinase [Bacillus sp. SD088]|uniref:cache domain-containing sensor histidine kinase n=1 Tax=Bacillus sp. SD088 TaxID=2782012 RepID=UPI001A973D3E|nr:histidine kinase [Bacillus sp. SD088]MBO0995719.1 histidine kinase [Bacillus sp. SD088]